MRRGVAKRSVNLSLWIVTFSIISLLLLSFFPIVSFTEDDFVKDGLFFNLEMMKNSNNQEIVNLSKQVDLMIILLWIMLILSLISILIITFHAASDKSIKRHFAIVFFVISILIINLLVLNNEYSLIIKVENNNLISLSTIIPSIKYFYITFIFSAILLIFSILLNILIIFHLVKIFIFSKDKKLDKKEKIVKKSEEPIIITKPAEKPTDKKSIALEEWLKKESNKIEKEELFPNDTKEPIISTTDDIINEIPKERDEIKIEDNKPYPKVNESKFSPFPAEKTKETYKGSDDIKIARSFEDALSSAIQKRQINDTEPVKIKKQDIIIERDSLYKDKQVVEADPIINDDKKEKLSESEIITTELIVKCPQCKHIFATKKEGEITKIKCPTCGKEGIAK